MPECKKAEEATKSDTLPAGKVLNFLHRGPYATVRDHYADMMKYVETQEMSVSQPAWEIHLNDPSSVASEEALETDVFASASGQPPRS